MHGNLQQSPENQVSVLPEKSTQTEICLQLYQPTCTQGQLGKRTNDQVTDFGHVFHGKTNSFVCPRLGAFCGYRE